MSDALSYRVAVAPWGSTLGEQALAIRIEVFVHEQLVPMEEERDDIDYTAHHVIAFAGDEAAATGRVFTTSDPSVAKIGRMAVLKNHRGRGAGSAIMAALMDEARRWGCTEAQLSAQVHAIPFYERHGFQCISDVYMDANIPHRTMKRTLA